MKYQIYLHAHVKSVISTWNALEFLEDRRRSFEVVEELVQIFVSELLSLLLEEARHGECDGAEVVVRLRHVFVCCPATPTAAIADRALP